MIRDAREKAGMSREAAAHELYLGTRTLFNYENHITIAPPEVVLNMQRVYNRPGLTAHYCSSVCPIGQASNCRPKKETA